MRKEGRMREGTGRGERGWEGGRGRQGLGHASERASAEAGTEKGGMHPVSGESKRCRFSSLCHPASETRYCTVM